MNNEPVLIIVAWLFYLSRVWRMFYCGEVLITLFQHC